jgi:hypothetical protein
MSLRCLFAYSQEIHRLNLLPSEIEANRLVTIQEAARLMSLSTDTVRRRYAHKFVRVSKRRLAMRLRDVLNPEAMTE